MQAKLKKYIIVCLAVLLALPLSACNFIKKSKLYTIPLTDGGEITIQTKPDDPTTLSLNEQDIYINRGQDSIGSITILNANSAEVIHTLVASDGTYHSILSDDWSTSKTFSGTSLTDFSLSSKDSSFYVKVLNTSYAIMFVLNEGITTDTINDLVNSFDIKVKTTGTGNIIDNIPATTEELLAMLQKTETEAKIKELVKNDILWSDLNILINDASIHAGMTVQELADLGWTFNPKDYFESKDDKYILTIGERTEKNIKLSHKDYKEPNFSFYIELVNPTHENIEIKDAQVCLIRFSALDGNKLDKMPKVQFLDELALGSDEKTLANVFTELYKDYGTWSTTEEGTLIEYTSEDNTKGMTLQFKKMIGLTSIKLIDYAIGVNAMQDALAEDTKDQATSSEEGSKQVTEDAATEDSSVEPSTNE